MPIDEALLDSIRANIGAEVTTSLGTLTAVTIRRYARAIDDANPLYHDTEFARRHGYADVVAPPNLVSAVSVWDEGPATEDLREDGTPTTVQLAGLPTSGVRVMGGGAAMEFHTPITAGTTIVERTTLVDAELTTGRQGDIIVVTYRQEFMDDDGVALVTSTRKVLVR